MSIYTFENTLKIFLIRHGESEANLNTELFKNGNLNIPLTNRGRDQAKYLGQYLKKNKIIFDKVYSSSLDRAMETAKICINQVDSKIPIIPSKEISELTSAEYKLVLKKGGHLVQNMNLFNKQGNWFLPPNGESLKMAIVRIASWFNSEIVYNPDHIGKNLNIGIFGHGHTNRMILLNIMGFDQVFLNNIAIDNTGVCQIEYSKEGWKIININNTRHLP